MTRRRLNERNAHQPDSQSWFWTPEWQEKERAADADFAVGRVRRHESTEEFLAALDEVIARDPGAEDAHLLRSPTNARRLLEALERSEESVGERTTVADLIERYDLRREDDA